MQTLDVEARIKQLLTTRVGIPPEEMKLHARIIDDLGLDSLDLVQLGIAAEGEFNIALDDEQIRGLSTVGDIVNLVKRLTDEQQGSARVVPPESGLDG